MANLNKVLLMGRLTRDPQQRFVSSGQSVCEIGLAINRVFTVNGEKREETTFVDCEAWGRDADNIAKFLKKGQPLFIEGRLKFDSWQTKEGEKRSKLRVVVDRFQFIGAPSGQGGGRSTGSDDLDPADFGVDQGGRGGPPPESAGAESDVPF
jgi:single-strand DNA-binding protein